MCKVPRISMCTIGMRKLAYYLDHYHAYGANMTAIWQVIFA